MATRTQLGDSLHDASAVPTPTGHALQRWDQRTPADSVSPERAWQNAWEMTLDHPEYNRIDEARYHHDSRVVLCRKGTALVTVYAVDGRDARSIVRQAILDQFHVDI